MRTITMPLVRIACCVLMFLAGVARADGVVPPSQSTDVTNGWIMFSMTATGPVKVLMIPTLYYHGLDNGTKGKVEGGEHKLRRDTGKLPIFIGLSKLVLERDDPMGSIKILDLPVGEYEFDRFAAFGGNGTVVYSSPGFRMRFTVKPGQINYLGNLNFDFNNLPNVGVRVYGDFASRDEALFRERHTNLAQIPLSSSLDTSNDTAPPQSQPTPEG